MSAWKYVMFQDKHGRHFPVIFPSELVHSDTAEAIQHAYRDSELSAGKCDWDCPQPVSAGFVGHIQVGKLGGDSETLKMKSHEDDERIINTYPFARGDGFEREARNTFRKAE